MQETPPITLSISRNSIGLVAKIQKRMKREEVCGCVREREGETTNRTKWEKSARILLFHSASNVAVAPESG